MANVFANWLASFCLLFSQTDLLDEPLALTDDESEHLISLSGLLQLRVLNRDPESTVENFPIYYWAVKLDPESFEAACNTPVRAAFLTPQSIRSFLNHTEMALTGGYDEEWLSSNENQKVTVQGYLWHAHTVHHQTPIMMDLKPWISKEID